MLKIPTGGGKTLLAVEAIREYHDHFAHKRQGLVVWIVPSETIYSQTVTKLRDKRHHLRQLIDQCSGGRTLIVEKGKRLTLADIENNLVLLFVMIQSISRKNNKAALKVFQDSGGYEGFFPPDHRFDNHERLLKQFPNLDRIGEGGAEAFPLIRTSLANAIRVSEPFIIIDEIHKVFSDMARKTIDGLNPEMVLGLSATPKENMNILVSISGLELKEEEMIKLDMHIKSPTSPQENDWKSMVKEIKNHRDALERHAKRYHKSGGRYIRPIALLQAERTGKEQRHKGAVHSLDVKEYLEALGIAPEEIAIKTSAQNDIENIDLFSSHCVIRYIITRRALQEGWDCSFAYILGIIPNVSSNTSITQLVGRVLRQPQAKKCGVPQLDESYIYYCHGGTQAILDYVAGGFKHEGLEDLVNKVQMEGHQELNPTVTAQVKKEYRDPEYLAALYLPVWVVNNDEHRRFSYQLDICSHIDLSTFSPGEKELQEIAASLSPENRERSGFRITLDAESHFREHTEQNVEYSAAQISASYLTHRYSDIYPNGFLAHQGAMRHLQLVAQHIGEDTLQAHFGYICALLYDYCIKERQRQEEQIFLDKLHNNQLVLAVSNDESMGYKVPAKDSFTRTKESSAWQYYLYDEIDLTTMNSLEREVGDILDAQQKILWWFRNKVGQAWYSIPGWRQQRIYPDFIATKRGTNGKLEISYLFESKGKHLLGNVDTEYKERVLKLMTKQSQEKRIKKYQQGEQLSLFELHDNFGFYLIAEGKQERQIRELYQ